MHLQPGIFAGTFLVGGKAGLGFDSWQLRSTTFVWSRRKFPKLASSPCKTTSSSCLWHKGMCISCQGLLTGQGRRLGAVLVCV